MLDITICKNTHTQKIRHEPKQQVVKRTEHPFDVEILSDITIRTQNVTQNVTHLIEQNVGYHYMQTYTKKPQ